MARTTDKDNGAGAVDSPIVTSNITSPKMKLTLDTTTGIDHHQHKHTQSVERLTSPYRHRSAIEDEDDVQNKSSRIDNILDAREAEKRETLAKQRDHYLNTDPRSTTMNTSNSIGSTNDNTSTFRNLLKFAKLLYTDIDTHTERLYYVLTLELFFLFLTFTQYPYLDKKNKFLTPLFTGCQTSLIGETLREIYAWRQTRCIVDEEKTIGTLHRRTPSMASTSEYNSDFNDAFTVSIHEHLKFLIWGSLNGLLSSYWIDFLVSLFSTKLFCVFLDQTLGTILFQTLYTLFLCLWDGEVEVTLISAPSTRIPLTWDAFKTHYTRMLWKYMRLSWLVWPLVSLISFTTVPPTWIFPLNCLFSTIFTVLLGL